jgi:hypothetical protein
VWGQRQLLVKSESSAVVGANVPSIVSVTSAVHVCASIEQRAKPRCVVSLDRVVQRHLNTKRKQRAVHGASKDAR